MQANPSKLVVILKNTVELLLCTNDENNAVVRKRLALKEQGGNLQVNQALNE